MADGAGQAEAEAAEATVFRCGVCRRSAFTGRRSHLHSAGHQRRLREALGRLREKVEAARETLRRAQVVPFSAAEHERPCWCLCCGRAVRRHLQHGRLALLHGGLVQHLASHEHRKAVSAFWWENKADPKLKAQFLFSAEEYERFMESLSKALDAYEAEEDKTIQEMAAHIQEVERSRQELLSAALEPQKENELCDGAAAVNILTGNLSESVSTLEEQELHGPSRGQALLQEPPGCTYRSGPEVEWLEAGSSLTFIGHKKTEGALNIHTGAKPPWLIQEDEESQGQIGPSYEEFLKETAKQKLKKLPPHRVGANFDHTSQTGEGWLPSFGRVWNHGRRWQSRNQFKHETGHKLHQPKRKKPKWTE